MEIICTRPSCTRPRNFFSDLDDRSNLKTVQQRYCTNCGMPLILADRYLTISLLGEGGFGRAFLARDRYTPTMRQCVVKQFQPASNLGTQALEIAQNLFEREAEVLENLGNKHEQIPDLFAFFPLIVPGKDPTKNKQQFFYLVQEFIDGSTLEAELVTKKKFTETETIFVLQEILKILQFVHDNGSIHRDIKPSNIMRDRRGIIYLLDFGAVKYVTVGENQSQTSSTGVYSMGYAPPEQKSGAQVYPSTDLYALAVTCINLLTGKPAEELYDSYQNNWQWQQYASETSDRLKKILDRMLMLAPSDRFHSATEVLQALESKQKTKQKQVQPAPVVNTKPDPNPTPINLPAPAKPTSRPVKKKPPRQPFTLVETFTSAAFTGFEGTLLSIALMKSLPLLGLSMGLSAGIWGAILGGLVFAQNRRIIEKVDLLIIAGVSLGLFYWLPFLRGQFDIQTVIILGVVAAAAGVAVASIFRLVYNFLSRSIGK